MLVMLADAIRHGTGHRPRLFVADGMLADAHGPALSQERADAVVTNAEVGGAKPVYELDGAPVEQLARIVAMDARRPRLPFGPHSARICQTSLVESIAEMRRNVVDQHLRHALAAKHVLHTLHVLVLAEQVAVSLALPCRVESVLARQADAKEEIELGPILLARKRPIMRPADLIHADAENACKPWSIRPTFESVLRDEPIIGLRRGRG